MSDKYNSDNIPFGDIPEWKTLFNQAMAKKKEAEASSAKTGVSPSTTPPSKNSNDCMEVNGTTSSTNMKEGKQEISTSKDMSNSKPVAGSRPLKRSTSKLTGNREEASRKKPQTTVKKEKPEFQVPWEWDERPSMEDCEVEDGYDTEVELKCWDCHVVYGYCLSSDRGSSFICLQCRMDDAEWENSQAQ